MIMMRGVYTLLVVVCAVLLWQCGGVKPKTEDKSEVVTYAPGTRTMKRSVAGGVYSVRTQAEYDAMVKHYWDDFDFAADSAVIAYDTIDIIYAMGDYVAVIPPQRADSLLRTLIRRASVSRPVLDFFAMVTEAVLHDPNSPYRNDEYYIPVLEEMLKSPLWDEYDRIAPMYDLEVARKNRIGNVANDFVYTLRDGSRGRLHDIDANYTILMFANPGCPMCRAIMDEITASPLLNEMSEMGMLKVLSVYPDEDIVAWRDYLSQMPSTWINAYDDGMVITNESLYNLNAIPSLYLLDSQKRVLVKDGVSVPQIEDVISIIESQR